MSWSAATRKVARHADKMITLFW